MQHQPKKVECQNKKLGSKYCEGDFVIEPEDFAFYEKIKVPPPTFCPECRMMRRMNFMNVYSLYKRKCDLCSEPIISMFSTNKPYKVYCSSCWWGDSWDGIDYAMEYDSNKNFFEQLNELMHKTPFMALDNQSMTLVDSQYVNYSSNLKNCYLLYFADDSENSAYCAFLHNIKECIDCYRIKDSELCYESIGLFKCYRVFFSEECDSCVDLWFSKNCFGSTNCFGCINLHNKSFCIFNQQVTKEEYNKFINGLNLNSYKVLNYYKNESQKFWLTKSVKNYIGNSLNINVIGDYVYESKNLKNGFMASGVENSSYIQFISIPKTKDSYDYSCWGANAELMYEVAIAGEGAYNIKYSFGCYPNTINVEYGVYTSACRDVFGCVNLKKKQYCVLNKQYSKDEYNSLVERIKKDMVDSPYIDTLGRVFKYGEFFPFNLSPFGYNETMANDFFPKNMEEIKLYKFNYFNKEKNNYQSSIKGKDIGDNFKESLNIKNEVVECECGNCFKYSNIELFVLTKLNLPVPVKCPECRRIERFNRVNKPLIFNRKCFKCKIDIKTTYAPDRPEIVYCEKCYQQEVY